MPANPSDAWGVKKLDGLVPTERPICYGVLKPGEYVPSGIALIRILDLEGDRVCDPRQLFRIGPALDAAFARSRLAGGEVLVSIQGTIGRIALAPASLSGANISRTIARVTIAKGYSARFVRQWLLSTRGQRALSDALVGTTRASLNIAELRAVEIPCPIEHEADRIADILDTVDDAIRQTERVIAKLEQVKAGMLQDLLTRGIDDNGEVRDPERHPEQFKDSPLGRIPKGWEVLPLGALARAPGAYGSVAPAGTYNPGLPRYVRITDIGDNGLLRTDSLASISEVAASSYFLREGDLCFARSGATVGKTYLYRPQDGRCAHAGYVIRFPVDTERCGAKYIFYWTKGPKYARWLGQTLRQGAQPNVNAVEYASHLVAVPPRREQDLISDCIDSQADRIMSEGSARAKLLATKQALGDDLLTGRVRVNAREGVPV